MQQPSSVDFFSAGFSAGGFLVATGFFPLPPNLLNTNSLLSTLPLASCLEAPSHLIWLLVLPYLPGLCDSWPGEERCSSAWFLNMGLAST